MSASITRIKAYVGKLNAMPDSRTPRRLTTVSTTIDTTQSSTVCCSSDGYAEVIAATPDEMDTATVRM